MMRIMLRKGQNLVMFLIAIVIITADRLTKHLSGEFTFCNIILCVKGTTNKGAAFGLLQDYSLFLVLMGVAVIFLALYFYSKTGSLPLKFAFSLILAGTISNLADRIVYGYIQDWLAFGFMQFPSFNIADASNFIGALILIISLIKKK